MPSDSDHNETHQQPHCYGSRRKKIEPHNLLQVVDYAKVKCNWAVARVFGSPPTETMTCVWWHLEDHLKITRKGRRNLLCSAPHWPELGVDIKTRVVNERYSGRRVYTCVLLECFQQYMLKYIKFFFLNLTCWNGGTSYKPMRLPCRQKQ